MTRKGGERVEPSACGHVEHLDSVFGLGCSVKGCSNYIAIRKGGGRESGLTVGKTLQRVKSGVAAANPAARLTHVHPWYEGPSSPPEDCENCVEREADIRAFEAENRILTDAMQKEIAKVRALEAELAALEKEAVEGSWRARAEKAEAELADMKTPNGIVQDGLTFRGFVKTRGETPTSAWLRAEKAEARVKELEAACREAKRAMDGWPGSGNSKAGEYDTRAQRLVDEALRGEDRG